MSNPPVHVFIVLIIIMGQLPIDCILSSPTQNLIFFAIFMSVDKIIGRGGYSSSPLGGLGASAPGYLHALRSILVQSESKFQC